jgi:hypothetical protein
MDLNLDEQTLLANFRRLGSEGKKELLDYAVFLQKKQRGNLAEEPDAENQCRLKTAPEKRPEAVKEPIFTE